MDLLEIRKFQDEFDRKHGWNWSKPTTFDDTLKHLNYATVAVLGELGEFANVLKKLRRMYDSTGNYDANLIPKLKEELIDCFIYLIILANILDVDIEKGYLEKMGENANRFKPFEV